jgi:flagellar hook-length control protein FliK
MVSESISSSTSAAQTSAKLTMTTNARANMKEASLQGPDFVSALLTSLAQAVPGTEAQPEPVMARSLTPNPEQGVKDDGNAVGRLLEPMGSVRHEGAETATPLKKSARRSENRPPDVRIANMDLATVQIIAAMNTAQPAIVSHWEKLKSGSGHGEVASSEPSEPSTSAELVQAFAEVVQANPAKEGVLIPDKDSLPASSAPAAPIATNTPSLQKPSLPESDEGHKFATRTDGRSANPKGLSVSPSMNSPDGRAAIPESIQPSALRVEPFARNASPVPSHESPSPKMEASGLDRTDAAQTAAVPKIAWATENYPENSAMPKDDRNESSFAIPAGFLSGTLHYNSTATQVDKAALAPPIPEIALGVLKSAESQPVQALEPSVSMPSAAIQVEPRTTEKSSDAAGPKTERVGGIKAASRVEPLGSAEVGYRDPKMDSASSGAEENSQKNSGKNSGDHASNSAVDHRQGNHGTSSPETVSAEPPKSELAPTVSAGQGAGASGSSILPSSAVSGEGNSPANLAPPDPKGSNQSDGVTSSNGDNQQHPTLIQSAHLISEASKSDVKIALQGEQMGMVELHAKMTGDQVSASITVEHHDTHALLSADLPALHQLLNERQLRVSEIGLFHDSLSSAGSFHDEGAPAKREETWPQQANSSSSAGGEGSAAAITASEVRTGTSRIFDSRGRLSVRA